jgi:protein-arginine kinase activator protein McsA
MNFKSMLPSPSVLYIQEMEALKEILADAVANKDYREVASLEQSIKEIEEANKGNQSC